MRLINRFVIVLTALVLCECCAGQQIATPDAASIDASSITDAVKIEETIDAQGTNIAPAGKPWFNVVEGSIPILVTAPHATRPFRNGKYRFSDGAGTAAVAILLNKLTGVTAIYTTYESPSDPNYYDDNEFKAAILKQIKKRHPILLLDIHGSNRSRPYDVDFGTMNGQSLHGHQASLDLLMDSLKKEGVVNLSENFFSAADHQTITKFASKNGVTAIQLEINSAWLVPEQGGLYAHRFAELMRALVRYVAAEEQMKNAR
jgi:hypothetical protein